MNYKRLLSIKSTGFTKKFVGWYRLPHVLHVALITALFLFFSGVIQSAEPDGEIVNKVVYIVGDVPITQLDVDQMMDRIRRSKENPPRGMSIRGYAKDKLVTRAIVNMEARKESIIVSDERIDNEIERRMDFTGMKDRDRFERTVEKQTGLSFEEWVDDMRFELKKRQIIQIKVTVPVPEKSEVVAFYNKNKSKIGFEVSYREIVLKPKRGSISDEKRISNLSRDLWRNLSRNPSSFSTVARNTSDNVSIYKSAGGLHPYEPLPEIARDNQILAGVLSRMKPGQVSTVFRDRANQYYIIKMEGLRPVPLEKVEGMIRQRLYFEKEDSAFEEWMNQKKKETSIIDA